MTRACLVTALLILASLGAVTAQAARRPGLVEVYFHGRDFTRPAPAVTVPRVDVDTGRTVNDCSRLWVGRITAPLTGEVTFSAEADDGLRLVIGHTPVIDGWRPDRPREGRLAMKAGEALPLRLKRTYLQCVSVLPVKSASVVLAYFLPTVQMSPELMTARAGLRLLG